MKEYSQLSPNIQVILPDVMNALLIKGVKLHNWHDNRKWHLDSDMLLQFCRCVICTSSCIIRSKGVIFCAIHPLGLEKDEIPCPDFEVNKDVTVEQLLS